MDIDTGRFMFPKPFDLGIRLKDILQDKVDDKYYINTDKAKNLIQQLYDKGELVDDINTCDGTINNPHVKDYSNCIKARYDMGISNLGTDGCMVVERVNEINQIGNVCVTGHRENPNQGRVYDTNGIAPTLSCMTGGNREPMIVASRGRYIDDGSTKQNAELNKTGLTNTITTVEKDNYVLVKENIPNKINKIGQSSTVVAGTHGYANSCIFTNYRIRKLTPEECFILMGMTMEDCKLCRENDLTNTDLYKIAGNGLVTNCIMLIVEHLYKALVDHDYVTQDELIG